jgi:hypothetical protein
MSEHRAPLLTLPLPLLFEPPEHTHTHIHTNVSFPFNPFFSTPSLTRPHSHFSYFASLCSPTFSFLLPLATLRSACRSIQPPFYLDTRRPVSSLSAFVATCSRSFSPPTARTPACIIVRTLIFFSPYSSPFYLAPKLLECS